MVTCCTTLTASELTGIQAGVESTFRHTCTIRRPVSGSTPYTTVATEVPCLIQLRTGQSREAITTPAHSDGTPADLLVPLTTNIQANDVCHVNGARFTVRIIDPDMVACIRALGTVDR